MLSWPSIRHLLCARNAAVVRCNVGQDDGSLVSAAFTECWLTCAPKDALAESTRLASAIAMPSTCALWLLQLSAAVESPCEPSILQQAGLGPVYERD
jgi:hypothetical protein